jgi:hypothetical protein
MHLENRWIVFQRVASIHRPCWAEGVRLSASRCERPLLRSIAQRFQAMTLLEETPKIDPVVVPVKLNWDLKVRNQ